MATPAEIASRANVHRHVIDTTCGATYNPKYNRTYVCSRHHCNGNHVDVARNVAWTDTRDGARPSTRETDDLLRAALADWGL